MPNNEHLAILRQGAEVWNQWRKENPGILPDLANAELSSFRLSGVNLSGALLSRAILESADLSYSDLSHANLIEANLSAYDPPPCNLSHANLTEAELEDANLWRVDLSSAQLCRANLSGAILREADLSGADLSQADLSTAVLVRTNLEQANLTGCRVYGVSAWDLNLRGANQSNLIITNDFPAITVDNIEVAQFIYLLLNNKKIRDVVDTIGKKGVLILGRFTPERKAVLDAVREWLRQHDYLPMLFDFDLPTERDVTETVTTLARMSRFIIADLSEPSSIPKELEAIVPTLAIPVQPILEGAQRPYSMFKDYWKYSWVLAVQRYENLADLLASFEQKVIGPAEAKAIELNQLRRSASA